MSNNAKGFLPAMPLMFWAQVIPAWMKIIKEEGRPRIQGTVEHKGIMYSYGELEEGGGISITVAPGREALDAAERTIRYCREKEDQLRVLDDESWQDHNTHPMHEVFDQKKAEMIAERESWETRRAEAESVLGTIPEKVTFVIMFSEIDDTIYHLVRGEDISYTPEVKEKPKMKGGPIKKEATAA